MATDLGTSFDPPLPDGWYLIWCPGCLYSVSFTKADGMTYPADEWPQVADEACRHDCPARVAG